MKKINILGNKKQLSHRYIVYLLILFLQDALEELLAYANDVFKFNQEQIEAWTKVANLISKVLEQRVNNLNG